MLGEENRIYNFGPIEDIVEPKVITLECSNCKKELIDVFTEGEEPNLTLVALCGCGDKSYQQEIVGTFRFAAKPGVSVDAMDEEDGVITFTTSNLEI